MQRSMRMFVAIMVIVLLAASTKKPEVYRNGEFGIILPIPEGSVLCPAPQNQHDHGPVIVPGTNDKKVCNDLANSHVIDIFAGPNASYVSKDLNSYFEWECTNLGKGPCSPAPSDLQLAGLRSRAGRVDLPDGWLDIIVVTQAGKPDPAFDASVPSVNYDLRLHTTSAHLNQDLPIFRRVLETIKLSPTA